ncbi:jumonji superfamily protein [Cylindrobasidium torrendii FP15055 ss-10]|uniref:JmjC domain-containing histone demethylation protein 1 n=1 Tax=Cylindrobasidium torrendii FP15055 ss-10 TaxID=1314674 RepID=A0A0D7BDA9_9AGAR|nr:jumonji superfamily protein [Cylindrobasidium torrendii FP15055 ss-10]
MAASRRGRPRKAEGSSAEIKDEKCPACPETATTGDGKDDWIRCDACNVWYHWACAGNAEDYNMIDKWFCSGCLAEDTKRAITLKPPTRKSTRARPQRDYAGLHNNGVEADPQHFIRMMEGKPLKEDTFRRMDGADVGVEWLEEDELAMTEPVIIEKSTGLGLTMPDSDFTVQDVVDQVGPDTPLDVMDVGTQSASPGWTLGKWGEYFAKDSAEREKILNVISLEISGTPLGDQILPPRLVQEIDWVEKYWPSTRKGKGHLYPKVQLYCLMGVANAWTDWHVDFAGSSVYYHIVSGEKIFYFIRPTPANLAAYERWSGSEIQGRTWLGDLVDEVIKVKLTAGNTMIIPTAWIHAVQTPVDTLVFGGNFLHSYDVAGQLKVRDIEIATAVPRKFRFPHFTKLCWYVADKYLRDLKGHSPHPRVSRSMAQLADFLVSQARVLESGDEAAKKDVREQVPHDRVKDPSAVARELRWRARLASGLGSDDEGESVASAPSKAVAPPAKRGRKRKRPASEETEGIVEPDVAGPVRFRNFRPRRWDKVDVTKGDVEEKGVKAKRPRTEEEVLEWAGRADIEMDTKQEGEEDALWQEGTLVTTKQTVTKIRRTEKGMERERVERILEEWRFA